MGTTDTSSLTLLNRSLNLANFQNANPVKSHSLFTLAGVPLLPAMQCGQATNRQSTIIVLNLILGGHRFL